jgi:K+-sensing histidine kinase KdpD
MRNLVDNAIKFSPAHTRIQIVLAEVQGKVRVSVCNTVETNSITKLERLLDPSGFLSTPGTNNERGVGLGLHLCREYIALNYGEMEVSLEAEKVTVSFFLPGSPSSI